MEGGDGIGRVMVIEFQEQDSSAFDEVMEFVMNCATMLFFCNS